MLASYNSAFQNLTKAFGRACTLAAVICVAGTAVAAPSCKPIIGFRDVQFSPVQRETMERRWTALMWADASSCKSVSGDFEILFARLKENAPDADFVERFTWKSGLFEVSVELWEDEAVDGYWISSIAECTCK